jgi:hypothetical protein
MDKTRPEYQRVRLEFAKGIAMLRGLNSWAFLPEKQTKDCGEACREACLKAADKFLAIKGIAIEDDD